MRHTRAHTANRRSHHALKSAAISSCSNCGQSHVRHTVCIKCGYYRGKQVINMVQKLEKKQAKLKAKEKEEQK